MNAKKKYPRLSHLNAEAILVAIGDEFLPSDLKDRDPNKVQELCNHIDIVGSIYRAGATIHNRGVPFKTQVKKVLQAVETLKLLLTDDLIKHAARNQETLDSSDQLSLLPQTLDMFAEALTARPPITKAEMDPRSPFEKIAGFNLPVIYWKFVERRGVVKGKGFEQPDPPCVRFVHASLKALGICKRNGESYAKASIERAMKDMRASRPREKRRGKSA